MHTYTHTHTHTHTQTHTRTHTQPSAVWYPMALGTRFFSPYTPMHSSGRVIVLRHTFRKNTSSPRVTEWSLETKQKTKKKGGGWKGGEQKKGGGRTSSPRVTKWSQKQKKCFACMYTRKGCFFGKKNPLRQWSLKNNKGKRTSSPRVTEWSVV